MKRYVKEVANDAIKRIRADGQYPSSCVADICRIVLLCDRGMIGDLEAVKEIADIHRTGWMGRR